MKLSSEQNGLQDKKVAVVTGVTGQDGSYLAELLLDKGYEVVGVVRRSSIDNTGRIKGIIGREGFKVVQGDVTDSSSINFILHSYQPDEFYNLAAQSHVKTSFEQPLFTWDVNAKGVLNILEGIRHYSPHTRFYQASTSEMFGKNYTVEQKPLYTLDCHKCYQDEDTPFAPQSPYSVAKTAAHHAVQLYRRAYGLHASCGILFNHESERRGEQFVTRKITKWLGEFDSAMEDAKDSLGFEYDGPRYFDEDNIGFDGNWTHTFPKLRLGNLDAKRDWGHAEDYVRAMWLMVQQDDPGDYVVATGTTHTVREFLEVAFKEIGIDDFEPFVVIDPKFFRPAEVDYLLGDSTKAREKLGWSPKINFEQLVKRMVKHDDSRTASSHCTG